MTTIQIFIDQETIARINSARRDYGDKELKSVDDVQKFINRLIEDYTADSRNISR